MLLGNIPMWYLMWDLMQPFVLNSLPQNSHLYCLTCTWIALWIFSSLEVLNPFWHSCKNRKDLITLCKKCTSDDLALESKLLKISSTCTLANSSGGCYFGNKTLTLSCGMKAEFHEQPNDCVKSRIQNKKDHGRGSWHMIEFFWWGSKESNCTSLWLVQLWVTDIITCMYSKEERIFKTFGKI